MAPSTTGSKLFDLEQREKVGPDDVTVVIPTLNEAEGIGNVIDDLRREGFANILVVDGRSTDGTAQIASDKGAFVVLQHGTGKAGAIRTALDIVSTPYMAVMDGDCTYHASDLRNLLPYAKDYVEVIGSRLRGRENIPRINRLGNWIVSRAFKLLYSCPVSDVLSGMYLVRTDILKSQELSSQSFDIEVEIASTMASSGKVTEVPIQYGSRQGKRKLGSRHGFRILGTLFWMTYYENPMVLFGVLSSILAAPALGLLGWVAFEAITSGVFHSAFALFGVMLLLLASQGIAVALMSLVTKRSELRLRRAINARGVPI
jgi:dolichol-phosphate mannosyltransferase